MKTAPNLNTFSGRLLHLMQTQDVTQQEVAEACGLTHVGIGRICRNKNAECRASTALHLSRFFSCDLIWLIAGDRKSESSALTTLAEIATQTEA